MSVQRVTEKVEDVLRDPMISPAIKAKIRLAIEASTYPLTHVRFVIGDGGIPELDGMAPFTYASPAQAKDPEVPEAAYEDDQLHAAIRDASEWWK